MSSPDRPEALEAQQTLRSQARYAVGLLLVIYTVNHIDRQIMYILIEPVKADLALSDTQMGALVGSAFAIFYAFAGLPIARMADRGNRRNVIVWALAIWSAMTVASGLARGFWEMLAARVGVGVGEAGCSPPAHSMIVDSFPPEQRATALSVYQLGVPIGTLFGLAAGGFLADELGWRTAFFVVGAPGLVLAVVARTTMREPARGLQEEVEPVAAVLRFIARRPSMRHALLATSLQTLALAGMVAWHTSFLKRVHGLSLTEAGLVLGLISGIAGLVSTFAGGWLSDRLSQRDPRWYFWLPAIGALASVPFSVLAYTTPLASLAIAMLVGATLGNHVYSAVGHAIVQSLVRPRMRAVASAIALFAMNLVGFGVGPQLVGILSDWLGGADQVRYALVIVSGGMVWATLHYVLGARTYARDLAARDQSAST